MGLKPVILLFFLRHSGLQQDNAWLHMARVAMDCLYGCPMLPWPVLSPDLSLP